MHLPALETCTTPESHTAVRTEMARPSFLPSPGSFEVCEFLPQGFSFLELQELIGLVISRWCLQFLMNGQLSNCLLFLLGVSCEVSVAGPGSRAVGLQKSQGRGRFESLESPLVVPKKIAGLGLLFWPAPGETAAVLWTCCSATPFCRPCLRAV